MLCRAVLPSEALAHKAQRVLSANGYSSEIFRNTDKKAGCGYGVRISGNCEAAHALLLREGIPVKLMRIERGGV